MFLVFFHALILRELEAGRGHGVVAGEGGFARLIMSISRRCSASWLDLRIL